MKKIKIITALLAAFVACKPSSSPTPALVCTPASKGAWLYADNKISVCAPDAKTKIYGWQELKWQEQATKDAAPAEAAKP